MLMGMITWKGRCFLNIIDEKRLKFIHTVVNIILVITIISHNKPYCCYNWLYNWCCYIVIIAPYLHILWFDRSNGVVSILRIRSRALDAEGY